MLEYSRFEYLNLARQQTLTTTATQQRKRKRDNHEVPHEAPRRKLKANDAETGVLNLLLLQYYCEHCWATIHSRPGREFHKPLVKEGADRPRAVPYRWC